MAWPFFPGLEFTKVIVLSAAWPFSKTVVHEGTCSPVAWPPLACGSTPGLEFTKALVLPVAWPPFTDGLDPGLGNAGHILGDLTYTDTCHGMQQASHWTFSGAI